ncbi:uncharacterized protein ACOB8E_010125 [Sarcophilus harrisii]
MEAIVLGFPQAWILPGQWAAGTWLFSLGFQAAEPLEWIPPQASPTPTLELVIPAAKILHLERAGSSGTLPSISGALGKKPQVDFEGTLCAISPQPQNSLWIGGSVPSAGSPGNLAEPGDQRRGPLRATSEFLDSGTSSFLWCPQSPRPLDRSPSPSLLRDIHPTEPSPLSWDLFGKSSDPLLGRRTSLPHLLDWAGSGVPGRPLALQSWSRSEQDVRPPSLLDGVPQRVELVGQLQSARGTPKERAQETQRLEKALELSQIKCELLDLRQKEKPGPGDQGQEWNSDASEALGEGEGLLEGPRASTPHKSFDVMLLQEELAIIKEENEQLSLELSQSRRRLRTCLDQLHQLQAEKRLSHGWAQVLEAERTQLVGENVALLTVFQGPGGRAELRPASWQNGQCRRYPQFQKGPTTPQMGQAWETSCPKTHWEVAQYWKARWRQVANELKSKEEELEGVQRQRRHELCKVGLPRTPTVALPSSTTFLLPSISSRSCVSHRDVLPPPVNVHPSTLMFIPLICLKGSTQCPWDLPHFLKKNPNNLVIFYF